MLDTEIKRMVLRELMDQMDGVTRDGMKDHMLEHDEMDQPETDLEKTDAKDMHDVMVDDKKEPDEDDIPTIDPVVMLAKRFHK